MTVVPETSVMEGTCVQYNFTIVVLSTYLLTSIIDFRFQRILLFLLFISQDVHLKVYDGFFY